MEKSLEEEWSVSIPRLSSSWWVWWGSWDPGTLGDSCCGTYHTLVAAASVAEAKREIRSFQTKQF